jgi:hypothetical protein
VQSATSAKLIGGFGIVGLGVLAALATDLAVTSLSLPKLAFLLGGFVLLLPTIVVRDPQAYWLFLLVFTFPFDINKWLSSPEASEQLVDTYGMPASGIASVELFLTDIVLIVMVTPWLARVCLRKEEIYFPRIGHLFILYLAWGMIAALINAASFSLSLFALWRQLLYFLSFLYLINNVSTPLRLRCVVWALLLGFIVGAGTVIVWFERGIGTDTVAFASLHDQGGEQAGQSHKIGKKNTDPEVLTLGDSTRTFEFREPGQGSIKRSQGIFTHPAIPACLSGIILQVVLGYLIAAKSSVYRVLFSIVYVWGLIALVLTFSRGGAIGFVVGTLVFIAASSWSGLISRSVMRLVAVALTSAAIITVPLLLIYFGARPESFSMRFNLFEAELKAYSQHPLLGVGLNNATAAMKAERQELKDLGIPISQTEAADSYHLAMLAEVGPIGMIILYVFFGKILMIALRKMREAEADIKPLLVGMVAGLGALATQSIADEPVAGHAVACIAWLFAALIISIARCTKAETRSSP